MKKLSTLFTIIFAILSLTGCARDLSSSTYTSDSTMNVVLFGKLLTMREITIKENDSLGSNSTGALVGGISGGVLASKGNRAEMLGAGLAGAAAGAIIQQLAGTTKGMEYIIQVDTSKIRDDYYEGAASIRNALAAAKVNGIITVIQGKPGPKDEKIFEGQDVMVIISDKRTRIIPNRHIK